MKKHFLLLLLIFFLPYSLSAEDKVLHVGISTGYPPYYFYDDSQKPVGICVDILNHVAEQLDISVQYTSYPWKRLIHNGKEGIVDAIMPLFKTPDRQLFLIFPENNLIMESNNFFTLTSNPLTYSGNLDDVVEYSVGVVESYSYGEEFDKKSIPQKTVAKTGEQLLQQVLNKRVDIGIGNSMVITYLANQTNAADKIKFLSPSVTESPLYIGFSKKTTSVDFVTKFNKSLQEFKATKAYSVIIEKYNK